VLLLINKDCFDFYVWSSPFWLNTILLLIADVQLRGPDNLSGFFTHKTVKHGGTKLLTSGGEARVPAVQRYATFVLNLHSIFFLLHKPLFCTETNRFHSCRNEMISASNMMNTVSHKLIKNRY